jgi:transposase
MESERSKAYSSDLRWRMVYQRCLLGFPYPDIARHLNVDKSTVYRVVSLFEETGTVCTIQGYREKPQKKLSTRDEIAILTAVVEDPSMYLHELKHCLLQSTGTDISTASICKLLHKSGFSHKKLAFRAQQRREELRVKFMTEMTAYEPEMLVFVDETGSDKRSSLRKYGYALMGKRAVAEKVLVRGKRHSVISAMGIDGVLDTLITECSVNGDVFYDFVERKLLPQLLPFDGVNRNSVVIQLYTMFWKLNLL